jgi:2-oxoglutarate ferredoxin oxidoreductase subunit beta
MKENKYDYPGVEIHWCPGCGNFPIMDSLKESLVELDIKQEEFVLVTGIGQAAKTPHFMQVNFINGLHGRALPVATAVKAVNPSLEVLVMSGDGCMYSEGGNHLVHTIRRNVNITVLIHNNMVYGLTKGQASPTSQLGFKTKVQTGGVNNKPFNPIAFAISQDASFVAQAFAGDKKQLKDIIKQAIQHKGFAMVDILQPCVSFNKVNTYKWFKDRIYYLEKDYDPTNRIKAFEKAIEDNKYPLGIIYKNPNQNIFEENLAVYKDNDLTPIIKRKRNLKEIEKVFFKPI